MAVSYKYGDNPARPGATDLVGLTEILDFKKRMATNYSLCD
jgi:hypothetical protein